METTNRMQLYYSKLSPYARKVLIVAHELGVDGDIDLVPISTTPRKSSEELLTVNPLAKLPVLLVPELPPLFDSVVICEYLNTLANGDLFPAASGPQKWKTLRWHAMGNGLLDVLLAWRGEGNRPDKDEDLLRGYERKTLITLAQIESEANELASAPFSIGHIALTCAMAYLDFRYESLAWQEKFVDLASWHGDVGTRLSVQKTAIGAS